LTLYPEEFSYKAPPYEYEFERLPMDLILGDQGVRKRLEQGENIVALEESWAEPLKEYRERVRAVSLYE